MVVFSTLMGVALFEGAYRLYQYAFSETPLYDWTKFIMFFDGPGSIFRNVNDIFTYVPNSELTSRLIYYSEAAYSTEYEYTFRSNNFGLVQDRDLLPGLRSVLVLGDSFVEGQGAEPWFRQIAPVIEQSGYQPINGGFFGTGFLQWSALERHLAANDITISKLIVIFISDDLRRTIWNFPEQQLKCLRSG